MKYRSERIRVRVLLLCFWLAVSPAILNFEQASAMAQATRELTEDVLPTVNIEKDDKYSEFEIGIYPGEYLGDQLKILGRTKEEIAERFIAFLPTEMGAVFSNLDAKGGGLEILTLYMALGLIFNIAAGKPDIYKEIAEVGQFKSDTYGKYAFYKGLADMAAKATMGGWLFKRSSLTMSLGQSVRKFMDCFEAADKAGGLFSLREKYLGVTPYEITDDSCDLAVDAFKKVSNSKAVKVLKGVGDVIGFVDLAFSAFTFATEDEWKYLFNDGKVTYAQLKVSIDFSLAILGLACFGLSIWAVIAIFIVGLVLVGVDIYAQGLQDWGLKFIDCHEPLRNNDISFNMFVDATAAGSSDSRWEGSFAQRVKSALNKQQQEVQNLSSDAVKQLQGLKYAILSRFRVCRHYNGFDINDIDYKNNLAVIASKWKTKAEAESDSWWWPQFNPFSTREQDAESQYFGSWFYGSERVGNDAARWCYFNFDFFLIKLFQSTLQSFETSSENIVKIGSNPIIQLVQNRIQIAPFHYFPLLLNLMGFGNAGDRIASLDDFIYLCHYSLNADMAITAIKESGYFAAHMKAMSEQFSNLISGLEKMRDECFGLTTSNADYIKGSDSLKEIVDKYIDSPDDELTDEKFEEYKTRLDLEEPDSENKTYKGLVEKNVERLNAIIALLPLKAMTVSARIALLKVLAKQHIVRKRYLNACAIKYKLLENRLKSDDPFRVEAINGLGVPPANFPPGKAFIDGIIRVTAPDASGNQQAIDFDFTAGGEFWNPDASNLLLLRSNLHTMDAAMSTGFRAFESLYDLVSKGSSYDGSEISLDEINEYCAKIMRNMLAITKQIDKKTTKLKRRFLSTDGRIYLLGEAKDYSNFNVTESVPRVFATPDLAFSGHEDAATGEYVEDGVPDFLNMMNQDVE